MIKEISEIQISLLKVRGKCDDLANNIIYPSDDAYWNDVSRNLLSVALLRVLERKRHVTFSSIETIVLEVKEYIGSEEFFHFSKSYLNGTDQLVQKSISIIDKQIYEFLIFHRENNSRFKVR